VPTGSPGSYSLDIKGTGGINDGGALYKLLSPGVDPTLYVRYYIKYPSNANYSHHGIWMGGYSPPLTYPYPRAGLKPYGNDLFSAAVEDVDPIGTHRVDHYDYWMGMHQAGDGNYWGNLMLNNPSVQLKTGQWTCIEHMVKLNNPVTDTSGEHAIWINGTKVSHVGKGFPKGYWIWGNFYPDPTVSTTFEGLQWRNDPALNLNYIWLQHYAPDYPSGFSASMKFDHVVVAKGYIGCLVPTSGDTIAPAPPTNLRVQ